MHTCLKLVFAKNFADKHEEQTTFQGPGPSRETELAAETNLDISNDTKMQVQESETLWRMRRRMLSLWLYWCREMLVDEMRRSPFIRLPKGNNYTAEANACLGSLFKYVLGIQVVVRDGEHYAQLPPQRIGEALFQE